jgi:hypothetical protein
MFPLLQDKSVRQKQPLWLTVVLKPGLGQPQERVLGYPQEKGLVPQMGQKPSCVEVPHPPGLLLPVEGPVLLQVLRPHRNPEKRLGFPHRKSS